MERNRIQDDNYDEIQKVMRLLVDVIHGIQKNTILSTSVEKDTINRQVPIHVGAMVLVDMPRPSHKRMIAFVHEKHLVRKRSKVFILC